MVSTRSRPTGGCTGPIQPKPTPHLAFSGATASTWQVGGSVFARSKISSREMRGWDSTHTTKKLPDVECDKGTSTRDHRSSPYGFSSAFTKESTSTTEQQQASQTQTVIHIPNKLTDACARPPRLKAGPDKTIHSGRQLSAGRGPKISRCPT